MTWLVSVEVRQNERRRRLWRLRLTFEELTHEEVGGQPSHDFRWPQEVRSLSTVVVFSAARGNEARNHEQEHTLVDGAGPRGSGSGTAIRRGIQDLGDAVTVDILPA